MASRERGGCSGTAVLGAVQEKEWPLERQCMHRLFPALGELSKASDQSLIYAHGAGKVSVVSFLKPFSSALCCATFCGGVPVAGRRGEKQPCSNSYIVI